MSSFALAQGGGKIFPPGHGRNSRLFPPGVFHLGGEELRFRCLILFLISLLIRLPNRAGLIQIDRSGLR